jgi:hypothetical protein
MPADQMMYEGCGDGMQSSAIGDHDDDCRSMSVPRACSGVHEDLPLGRA